ncbi:hypothetical protein LOZ80_12050 [Paenibacillus sp. HWE-109]|uniref:hypothetical protein n=1 Tax=Paenibacillus sp. HWE-109 TaxID=1306526 RepID=UPI001EDF9D7A|nr:hypothetical protein [Paenibacillus sp. HWE-109]UKS29617.1 hypothetical protein LOZ80_12050 [Paenibacillus sp. HWE-109]
MNVVSATKDDLSGWLELTAEVEYLFGPMVSDPKYIKAIEKNINQTSAFCVRENDGAPGSFLLGGILFSSVNSPSYKMAKEVTVPRGKKLTELATKNMPLLLFKIPLKKQEGATVYMDNRRSFNIDDIGLKCPFLSNNQRKVRESEISFNPLSMSLGNINEETEVRLAMSYISKLLI